jgi:hypothetical protein
MYAIIIQNYSFVYTRFNKLEWLLAGWAFDVLAHNKPQRH